VINLRQGAVIRTNAIHKSIGFDRPLPPPDACSPPWGPRESRGAAGASTGSGDSLGSGELVGRVLAACTVRVVPSWIAARGVDALTATGTVMPLDAGLGRLYAATRLPAFKARATAESRAGVCSGMVDHRLSCAPPVSAPSLPGIEARPLEPMAVVGGDACGTAAVVAPLLTAVPASVGAAASVVASLLAAAEVPVVAAVLVVASLLVVAAVLDDATVVPVTSGEDPPGELSVVVVPATAPEGGAAELAVGPPVLVDGAPVAAAVVEGADPAEPVVCAPPAGVVVVGVTGVGVTQPAGGVPVVGGGLVPVAVPLGAGCAPEVVGGAVDVLVGDGVPPLTLLEGVAAGPAEAVPVPGTGSVFPPSPAGRVWVVELWPLGGQVAPAHSAKLSPCWAGPEAHGAVGMAGAARARAGSSHSPAMPARRQSDRPIRRRALVTVRS
jgi:hypothetical protein